MVVLVDLDNVLWDLDRKWIDSINTRYDYKYSTDNITDWDISQCFPLLTRDEIFTPILEKNFYDDFMPVKDGKWFIKQLLSDGDTIKIVTSSFLENITQKMNRFFTCYPMLRWKDVIITNCKQDVRGDVLIDDAVHNLVNGDYNKILMDKPHNRKYNAETNGMVRVKSLTEAYCVL